ncbi:hypothetical protein L227DRAFT_653173 [Lentinus tigrinus ALCF2SS1-6]|uniref:Uncharacterized protein n=1 Tax=Lentinus tigrinus ALCF2SS1-6 TaxID=1328759 RepID=A0A5C2SAT0_9APHY|nr:hypothetical protein L227DRAFT_653173 [Lentinus tigrinus ALCF2SS1-6]
MHRPSWQHLSRGSALPPPRPRLRHERSPLQPSSTIFVAIHRRSTWPPISDALAVDPFLLAIAYMIAQARSTSRECRAGGWAEVADIGEVEEVSDNGSIVSTSGVSSQDRRRSVVKGAMTKGITREKTGSLIKADDEEQEDDFEDGEDDVGKAREDSQIARGVPSAADRSLPPVGRERSGDGRGRLPDSADEQDSRARERLKSTQDLEKLLNRKRHDPVLPSDASRRPGGQGRSFLLSRGRDLGPGAYLSAVLGTSTCLRAVWDPRISGSAQAWETEMRLKCVGTGNQNALEGLARAKIGITGEGRRTIGRQEQDEAGKDGIRRQQDGEKAAKHGKMLSLQEAWPMEALPPVGRSRSMPTIDDRTGIGQDKSNNDMRTA